MNTDRLLHGTFTDADEFCDELFAYLTAVGQSQYDETVTQLEHARQTAALAEADGYDQPAQVAALLHDIGHLLLDEHDAHRDFLVEDLHHEIVGARYLTRWFGPDLGAPAALHVKAKRYLVATDPAYANSLSEASTRSLRVQGGPMTGKEVDDFLRLQHADLALALRRWDDNAKRVNVAVPELGHWRPAVCRCVRACLES